MYRDSSKTNFSFYDQSLDKRINQSKVSSSKKHFIVNSPQSKVTSNMSANPIKGFSERDNSIVSKDNIGVNDSKPKL